MFVPLHAHHAAYLEGHLCRLVVASGGREEERVLRPNDHQLGEEQTSPRYRVAHHEVSARLVPEQDAAITCIHGEPASEGEGGVEEGEGHVSAPLEGSSERCRGVRNLRGMEPAKEETEEGRRVGAAEAAEEGAIGDDAAEGGACRGGAPDVGEGRQEEENGCEEVFVETQNQRRRCVDELSVGLRRRQGHQLRRPNHHLQQRDPLMEKTYRNLGLGT